MLFAGGLILRMWDVGSRAMHGDEAEHAWFAWHLYNGTGYQYDPVYHGPLQFIGTSLSFFLFGVSETTGRLMAVLFGTALILLPYFFRRYLGRTAALLAAAYITISPAFVYVSRLERDDIFTCFFAFTLTIAIFGFVRTRQHRYLYLGAASAALSLSAMENTYITLFVFGTFLALVATSELLARGKFSSSIRSFWDRTGTVHQVNLPTLLILGAVLLLAFFFMVLTNHYLPMLLLTGGSVLLLVIRQTTFKEHLRLEGDSTLSSDSDSQGSLADSLRAISWQQWMNALTIVVAILFLTYSTFGTNLRGIWDWTQPILNTKQGSQGNHFFLNPARKDILGGLFYWLSQHGVHRGGQPWFYYTFLFSLYEQIAVILGLGGIFWFLRRPTFVTAFLSYWAILMFGIYSWAGEKFPWLMIHPLLPITLLAAMFMADLLRYAARVKWLVLAIVGLLALLEIHSMYEVNFVNGANPVEMMVYVQSAPDTPKVSQDILSISNKVTNGDTLPVTIDADESWPFAWYLRDMPDIAYVNYKSLAKKPYSTNPIIIADDAHQSFLPSSVAKNYTARHYILRWWFPETYKSLTWHSFGQNLKNPSYWGIVGNWLVHRRPFESYSPTRTVSFYYYVKKGLVTQY